MRFAIAVLALAATGSLAPASAGERAGTVLLAMPRPWFDPAHPLPETEAETETRIAGFAREVDAQVVELDAETDLFARTGFGRLDFVAMGAVAAYSESSLAWEVHSGIEWPGRPAPFGDKGRARCLFQLQSSAAQVPFAQWRPFEHGEHVNLAGLDEAATRRCVRAGVRALAWHAWRCRGQNAHFLAQGAWGRRQAAAVIFSEYHQPRECRHVLSVGAHDRAAAWETFRSKLRR
jgi:hypothetical protein